ncbi:MAG: 2-amino-4-hydroxy-6-hydroxymethyldihydropteridine diphosphokinase [Clostridia bacterium]|nr:2-amino-4-hydroxy-6-hydroxymethyldihydropteridine diphosphokinase [Clostridia bacterium]
MNTVKIRGLEVSACHGVHDYEKVKPQRFVFDADLEVDFYEAAKCDDLRKTVNYSAVCNLIAGIATHNSFNLIEKLAYECAFAVLDNSPVKRVTLTVFKPDAPVKQKFENVGVTVEVSRQRAYLSLGSSMGDRKKYLDGGIEKLGKTRGITVKKVSSYINTRPYGGVAQNEFLNCAAEIETYLTPRQLLDEIHRIEEESGRVRKRRWDDRTLDIDIIFFGREVIYEDDLTVPHPDYFRRDFVLAPLKEIAPEFFCPVQNKKIKDL